MRPASLPNLDARHSVRREFEYHTCSNPEGTHTYVITIFYRYIFYSPIGPAIWRETMTGSGTLPGVSGPRAKAAVRPRGSDLSPLDDNLLPLGRAKSNGDRNTRPVSTLGRRRRRFFDRALRVTFISREGTYCTRKRRSGTLAETRRYCYGECIAYGILMSECCRTYNTRGRIVVVPSRHSSRKASARVFEFFYIFSARPHPFRSMWQNNSVNE